MTNPSLQKKTAARILAVQSLYTQEIGGKKLDAAKQVVSALKKELANNKSEQKLRTGIAQEPSYPLLEAILAGVGERLPDIDKRLDSTLSAKWTRERMSQIVIAILQCGIFELFFHKDAKPHIIIDEYTRMARSFLSDAEADFVYGALSNLAKEYREV